MDKIKRGFLAAAVTGAAIVGMAGPANAGALYDSNTQWFQTSGSGYYATMTITTNVDVTNGGARVRVNSGSTTGGVYYRGPYGDSTVAASSLKQTWTLTAKGTSAVSCSVGFPSGFGCTVSSDGKIVTETDSTDFGASKPTSTSLPATTLIDNTGFSYLKLQSTWKANYKINGTTVSRSPGENNIYYG